MQTEERYRHECEIRDLCRKTHERGEGWLRRYVKGDKDSPPFKRWAGIREEFWQQFRRGNSGKPGEWL